MKQFKIIALACCTCLILFSECKNTSRKISKSIDLENCFDVCTLKQMHNQRELAIIKSEYENVDSVHSSIYERLITLNEQLISQCKCLRANCPTCDPPPLPKPACCDVDNPPICPLQYCNSFKLAMPNCLISEHELEYFNVFDTKDNKLGEINKEGVKEIREGLLFYPIIYSVDSLPNRYYISFVEKDNPIQYIVQFVQYN